MSDPLERLRSLPDVVGDDGPTPEDIRGRARRRQRRFRAASLIATVAVIGGAAIVWQQTRPQGEEIVAGPTEDQSSTSTSSTRTSSTTTPETLPPSQAPSGLRAVPVVDLADGDEITVSFDRADDARAATFMAVCAGEVVDLASQETAPDAELLEQCAEPVRAPSNPTSLTVKRRLTTPEGPVDCDSNLGRCVVAASLDGSNREMVWTPLGFRSTGSPDPLTIDTSVTGPVTDGTVIEVSGSGAPAGATVLIGQCLGVGAGSAADATCGAVRNAEVRVGADGTYRARFIAYRDIFTYPRQGSAAESGDWVACEPCVMRALRADRPSERVFAEIDVAADGPPTRPVVEIVEDGPFRPDQAVTLRGSGFQADGVAPTIGWCSTETSADRPASCLYPTVGFGVDLDADGRFRLEGYPLPSVDTAPPRSPRCSVSGSCVLGITPSEGLYLLFEGFDLTS